jgi:hypothetical protein
VVVSVPRSRCGITLNIFWVTRVADAGYSLIVHVMRVAVSPALTSEKDGDVIVRGRCDDILVPILVLSITCAVVLVCFFPISEAVPLFRWVRWSVGESFGGCEGGHNSFQEPINHFTGSASHFMLDSIRCERTAAEARSRRLRFALGRQTAKPLPVAIPPR